MKFSIVHEGCWGSLLTRKFKVYGFLTHCQFYKNHAKGVLTIKSKEKKTLHEIKEFLRRFPSIRKIDVLEVGEDNVVFRLDTFSERTVTEAVLKNDCIIISSVELKDGREIWRVAANSKKQLLKLLHELKKLGKVEVLKLKRMSYDAKLTKKQLTILNIARELGYYDWPRRITLTELAKRVGLSKSTVAEHLRKAESKLVEKFLGEHSQHRDLKER